MTFIKKCLVCLNMVSATLTYENMEEVDEEYEEVVIRMSMGQFSELFSLSANKISKI